MLKSYATDAVLFSMRRMAALNRLPKRIISDTGTQLVGGKAILEKQIISICFKNIKYYFSDDKTLSLSF